MAGALFIKLCCGANMIRNFMPGDRVDYLGTKQFTDQQGKPLSIRGVVGEIQSRVGKTETGYIVDFDGDGFIMDAAVLQLHKFTKQEIDKEREVEVRIRRRRGEDE
jgi:hypothetical protein